MKKHPVKPLDCPAVKTTLSQFLFTKTNLEQQGQIQAHVFECDACALAYFDLIESSLLTGALPEVSIPAPTASAGPAFDTADLYNLAAEPSRSNAELMPLPYPDDEKFVQIEKDEYIITLWEDEDEGLTLVGLKVKPGFVQSYKGRAVMLEDANKVLLLQGEIYSGEISEQRAIRLSKIKSPLLIALSGRPEGEF